MRAAPVLRSIRLPLSLIDQLMNGVSDMVLARNELSRKLRERFPDPELESTFERLSNCVADMRDSISKTRMRSEEHTSELQSLMRISYAVFCLKKKTQSKMTN